MVSSIAVVAIVLSLGLLSVWMANSSLPPVNDLWRQYKPLVKQAAKVYCVLCMTAFLAFYCWMLYQMFIHSEPSAVLAAFTICGAVVLCAVAAGWIATDWH